VPRRRPPGKILKRCEIAVVRPEPVAEIGRHARIDRLQVEDRIAVDDAQPQAAVRLEADDPHGSLSNHSSSSGLPM